MAQIERRGDRYRARIRRQGQPDISKTFLLKEDAQKWARKAESELERGIYLTDLEEARSTTIRQAADRFINDYIPTLSHGHREKNRLEALLERTGWGKVALTNLKGKDVAAYIKERESAKAKPDTIRLDLALLSRLYKYAVQEWGMEGLANPVNSVRKPSLKNTARTRRLEDGEEEKLLAAAHADLKTVIQFALETCMRREEIASLDWSNVDLKKRTALLLKTKNGEARSVPLTLTAQKVLLGLPRQLSGRIFGLSKDQITDRMRTTVKRAGLSNLRFHDLRHEATSRLFENTSLDIMEISRITGHKSLAMLSRYTHLRSEHLVKKLDECIQKKEF